MQTFVRHVINPVHGVQQTGFTVAWPTFTVTAASFSRSTAMITIRDSFKTYQDVQVDH